MQYQSFRGSDLREALGQVKQTLGPNALIETTRQVTNGQAGGLERSYVEVTAAAPAGIDWPFAAKAGLRTNANRPPSASGKQGKAASQSFQLLGGAHPDVERELSNLRAMVEELNANLPPRERALSMLHARGIEGALARDIANGAARPAKKGREALQKWLHERVRERIEVAPDLLNTEGQLVLAAVGPTGVGKTTTLAKLAARARLDLGRSVAVISLDSFRVGAAEQWQRYASLMGIPLHLVHEAAAFKRALRETRADIVLVDTAGRSAHSVGSVLADSLRGMSQPRVCVSLVIPAWLRASDAERVVEGYADPALTHVIVTKLDETQQIGGSLHAALPRRLPLAYLCNGPRVPEDITDATRDSVLSALFPQDA
ncbi:MAG: flagellar biosynthesis protein FlhF [Polyangiaceae bacterium]